MNELDELVIDPKFHPYSGWLDDPREPPYKGNEMPAIQQHRGEFLEFASKLNKRGRCLQIGLGTAGASQAVFSHLFKEAWTIEIDPTVAPAFATDHNIIRGNSCDHNIVRRCASLAPFDLLFLDGDKDYGIVRTDYSNYSPMVSPGGVIAFHDAIPYEGNISTITVFNFIEELKAQGKPFLTIGTLLGIAYCYQS